MKKKINLFVTLLVIVGIFCGVSCKNEVPGFYMDTVLTLDKTNVNAIAYPGMNYISWTPVANASGYILYIHENGNCISTRSFNYADALQYNDINIKNDVEYTYYVEAESASSTGRSVVTQNSMSKGVTVKAIVPHNVKAIELVNYEKDKHNENGDYYENVESNYLSRDKIKLTSEKNKICITFPSKVYLTYEVALLNSDEEVLYTKYLSDNAKNDVMLYTDFTVSTPGDYKAKVIVKSVNPHFIDSSVMSYLGTVYPWEKIANFVDEDGNQILDSIIREDNGNYGWNVITLPSIPRKEGYEVSNYWHDEYGVTYSPGSSYSLENSTTTFIAKYTEIPTEPGEMKLSTDDIRYVSSGDRYTFSSYIYEGTTYSVTWADYYEGKEELEYLLYTYNGSTEMCDVKVSAYDEYGNYYFTEADSGYDSPCTFTASSTGYCYIVVEPYSEGNSGYCAIKVTEKVTEN